MMPLEDRRCGATAMGSSDKMAIPSLSFGDLLASTACPSGVLIKRNTKDAFFRSSTSAPNQFYTERLKTVWVKGRHRPFEK